MTGGLPEGFVPYRDRPARVGMLGLGRVYDLTVTGYRDNDDAEVVALCDTDASKLSLREADWPEARTYDDLEDFLGHDMDLVEVLVPTPAHRDVVCQVLDAGFHVNVQKPMARTLADADAMLDAEPATDGCFASWRTSSSTNRCSASRQSWRTATSGSPPGST